MSKSVQPARIKRLSNLEIANEMYKFAFMTKKYQYAKKFPQLTQDELHQKTVSYFVALPNM